MVTNILEEQTSFLDMTFPCNGDNLYKTLWCPNQEGHNLYDCSHKNLKPVYILCGFFFERDTLIYLPFSIFGTWCCIALSHFTSFLSPAHCGHCPVMEVCTWTVGHGSLRYVAVMWYHNTLFCCPIFPSVSQSWVSLELCLFCTVLNCGRGTTVSSSSSSYSFFVWTTTIELW